MPILCLSTHPGIGIMDDTAGIVARIFAELGANGPVERSILLQDCHFIGQRFRCGGLQAVWLAVATVIEFYDDRGSLARQVPRAA